MLKPRLKFQRGFTLVEMMVGIVVGLIVLWGMSSVYLNSARSSRTTTTANQLNQDMRAVMDIMVNDIRRAGYWEGASAGTNPFTCTQGIPNNTLCSQTRDIQLLPLSVSNPYADCILYSYDRDAGNPGPTTGDDFFGFRLNTATRVVQTLVAVGIANTVPATTCTTDANWQNLTDERAIVVTELSMVNGVGTDVDPNDTDPNNASKCIAFKAATYDETASSTYSAWTAKPATGVYQGRACDAAAPNAVAASAADATNTFIETRQVRIRMTAQSVIDPTLTRTLTETVLVRNNRLVSPL